jgi:beta-lactamase regulating signal transducer with metallopeptidase domain
MIALSMAYTVLVSAGIYLAAYALEHGLRALYKPARLVWVGAIFLALLAGVTAFSRSRVTADQKTPAATSWGTRQAPARSSGFTPTRTVTVPSTSAVNRFDEALMLIWISASLVALAAFGGAFRRLRRITSGGHLAEVAGVQVAVTPEAGPLVIGFLKPQIVLPQWILALDAAQQELVIAHEQSHAGNRDPALLAFAVVSVIVAPWNPLLWYMLRQLRRAIEIDCDRRVLARHPDVHSYADLLLAVASRNRANITIATGLAASASSLEQRFSFMKKTSPQPYRILSSLGLAALALVATAMVPRPVPQRAPALLGIQGKGGTRATGRLRVSGAEDFAAYRAVSAGGTLSALGQPSAPWPIVSGHSEEFAGTTVFDVDLTEGAVEFVSKDTTSIHIEASMGGTSPTAWLSATGHHLILEKGGTGISLAAPDKISAKSAR